MHSEKNTARVLTATSKALSCRELPVKRQLLLPPLGPPVFLVLASFLLLHAARATSSQFELNSAAETLVLRDQYLQSIFLASVTFKSSLRQLEEKFYLFTFVLMI